MSKSMNHRAWQEPSVTGGDFAFHMTSFTASGPTSGGAILRVTNP